MIVPCIRVLKATMNTLSKKFSSKFVSTLKASVDCHIMKNVKHFSWLQLWTHGSNLSDAQVLNPTLSKQTCSNVKSVNLEGTSLDINSQTASTSVENVEKKYPAKRFLVI